MGEAGFAAGLLAAGEVHRSGRALGARLTLAAQTERSFPVAGGHVLTRRLFVTLGPLYRLDGGGGPVRVEVGASAVAAWLTVRGAGYPQDLSEADPDFGAAATLILTARGTLAPFVALDVLGWPRTRTAVDLQSGHGMQLPRGEVNLVLGVAWQAR